MEELLTPFSVAHKVSPSIYALQVSHAPGYHGVLVVTSMHAVSGVCHAMLVMRQVGGVYVMLLC